MLEALGGEAKPVTAASRAKEQARRNTWLKEREARRRSQEGVEVSKKCAAELFAELEKTVADEPGADIRFKSVNKAARIWTQAPGNEGTTVTILWSLAYSNALIDSGLHVRLWEGYAGTPGEGVIAFESAREIGKHNFDFEWGESGRWLWQHRDTKRYYDTASLAAFLLGLLVDYSNRSPKRESP